MDRGQGIREKTGDEAQRMRDGNRHRGGDLERGTWNKGKKRRHRIGNRRLRWRGGKGGEEDLEWMTWDWEWETEMEDE